MTPTLSLRQTAVFDMFKVEIGAKVCVGSSASTAKRGIVRYIGETHFAGGEWIGVQLYEKDGKNDGSVDDTRYFDCEPEHGLFARRVCLVVCSSLCNMLKILNT